ncbi:MAG: phosphotransferase family protein [Alphaproteobacteria bacterium]|nr:phosphotransferase family protein [Alphaproteobacteria bacterium]
MTPGEGLDDPARVRALEAWLAASLAARHVTIAAPTKLGGGAIQENWAIDAAVDGGPRDGSHAWVLRTDAPSRVAASLTRAQEYTLIAAAHDAGVTVPEPIALCADTSVLGRAFYVMRRIGGTAAGHLLVRDDRWRGDRVALVARLGGELARIHGIRPPRGDLDFLPMPDGPPARVAVARHRRWLDGYHMARPALEWGLRWLDRNAPPRPAQLTLLHGDFRTGNYMVDETGLTGILDWEFASWGDPLEDLGWFCARCWRFGADGREAGGIGAREDFYRAYEAAAGHAVDRAAVDYWETMAHARWAVIALMQGERHVSGEEPSLDLALTGRRVAELEYELLQRTTP